MFSRVFSFIAQSFIVLQSLFKFQEFKLLCLIPVIEFYGIELTLVSWLKILNLLNI